MNNEFCVVVRNDNGVPYFVSTVHTEDEAKKLRELLTEGEVVTAEEGRRTRYVMNEKQHERYQHY